MRAAYFRRSARTASGMSCSPPSPSSCTQGGTETGCAAAIATDIASLRRCSHAYLLKLFPLMFRRQVPSARVDAARKRGNRGDGRRFSRQPMIPDASCSPPSGEREPPLMPARIHRAKLLGDRVLDGRGLCVKRPLSDRSIQRANPPRATADRPPVGRPFFLQHPSSRQEASSPLRLGTGASRSSGSGPRRVHV